MSVSMIIFVGALLVLVVACRACWRFRLKQGRATAQRERGTRRITLRTNPAYAQMEERDRRFWLECQRLALQRERQAAELALKREELELRRYIALHHVAPETYIVDCDPRSITPLPSLRPQSSEKAIAAAIPQTSLPPAYDLIDIFRSSEISLSASSWPRGQTGSRCSSRPASFTTRLSAPPQATARPPCSGA